jgi:glucokinase
MMILCGDIGATKTQMGLYRYRDDTLELEHSSAFTSSAYAGLTEIIEAFLAEAPAERIEIACFGVAGPVIQDRVEATNLPWQITGHKVAQEKGLARVVLINDLVAMAWGINALGEASLATVHSGDATPADNDALLLTPHPSPLTLHAGDATSWGNAALIAAGTGLGMALLLPGQGIRLPMPSEGGHMDFAPRNDEEIGLLQFLQGRFGRHVSIERVVSGMGLRNIYEYLVAANFAAEDPALRRELQCSEAPARLISEAALAGRSRLCMKALDMFVAAYGAAAGNLALLGMAVGGVYLGGGIAPQILPKLTGGLFMEAFLDKGRFRSLLERIPVRVILKTETAMLGAAYHAARILKSIAAA